MSEDKKTSLGPLDRTTGIVFFVGLVLACTLIAFGVCSQTLDLSLSLRLIFLAIFTIALALGWFAFTVSENRDEFFLAFLGSSIFAGSLIGMILINSVILFWLSLILLGLIAVVDAYLFNFFLSKKGYWEITLSLIYVAWVVTSLFITVGNTPYFAYAKSAIALSKIHWFLDVRYFITFVFFILSVGDAVLTAFQAGQPNISILPKNIKLPDVGGDPHSIVRAIFQPFVIFLNVIIHDLIVYFIDKILQLIALFLVYLYRTVVNIVNNFFNLLLKQSLLKSIIRTLLSFAMILLFAHGVLLILPHLYFYLTNFNPFSLTLTRPIISLAWTIGFFLFTFVSILSVSALWECRHEALFQAISGGTIIIIALSISGAAMYVAASIPKLNIVGFNSLGLFSFLILIFVGVVVVLQLAQKITSLSSGVDKQIATEQKTSEKLEKKADKERASVAQVQHNWILSVLASVLLISSISVFIFPNIPNIRNAISHDVRAINQSEKALAQRDTNLVLIETKTKAEVAHKLTKDKKNDTTSIAQIKHKTKGTTESFTSMLSEQKKQRTESNKPRSEVPKSSADNVEESVSPMQQTLPQLHLRSTDRILSVENVKAMLANLDFYDRGYNANGKGIIHQYEFQTIVDEQVLFDHTTGLMWQQSGSINSMSYTDAENYILGLKNQRFAGYDDWRLPTLEEAMSLIEREEMNHNLHIDPRFDRKQPWIWTADKESASQAWVVSFLRGDCYHDHVLINSYVRAVRPAATDSTKGGTGTTIIVRPAPSFIDKTSNQIVVPDVEGYIFNDAIKTLWKAGLILGDTSIVIVETLLPETVISQSIKGGTKVKKGTVIDLKLSDLPERFYKQQ